MLREPSPKYSVAAAVQQCTTRHHEVGEGRNHSHFHLLLKYRLRACNCFSCCDAVWNTHPQNAAVFAGHLPKNSAVFAMHLSKTLLCLQYTCPKLCCLKCTCPKMLFYLQSTFPKSCCVCNAPAQNPVLFAAPVQNAALFKMHLPKTLLCLQCTCPKCCFV